MNKKYADAIAHLKRAKVLLLTKGWIKGAYGVDIPVPTGAYVRDTSPYEKEYGIPAHPYSRAIVRRPRNACAFCSLGALAASAGGGWPDRHFAEWAAWANADNTAGHIVIDALQAVSISSDPVLFMADFNDLLDTTLADVCRRFDHAIARLTLQGFETE